MYHVGNMIYRKSLRYTLLVVGISLLGLLAKSFSLPGLTIRQAIALPLFIGAGALICGTTLRVIPGLISSRLQTVAQASDLNLMEDYRKTQTTEHLDVLWQRVFQFECFSNTSSRASTGGGEGGCLDLDGDGLADGDAKDNHAAEMAKVDFLARAGEALASHLPQIRQMHLLGLDLRYLEDWRDGAYLDCSDTKLREQFDGNSTLTSVRRRCGLWGGMAMRRFTVRKVSRNLWFRFITRMIAMEVGSSVERLNRMYKTDLFNSQVLLWPEEAESQWLGKFEGARDEVLRRRRQAVQNVFGPDIETAGEVLDRMLYLDFAMATELRMRYDVEYCLGGLGYDGLSDLESGCREPRDLKEARRLARRAGKGRIAMKRFLGEHRPELLEPENAMRLRAVEIAFHIDKSGLRRGIIGRVIRQRNEDKKRPIDELLAIVDATADDERPAARRLVAVRIHHELTRLARSGYHRLLASLAY